MFGLFSSDKKKTTKNLLSDLQVDFHNHLIPGVDDGSQSVEDTRQILTHLRDMGYKKIFTSPHIMGVKYTNTKPQLIQCCEQLLNEDLPIKIDVIAEYLLDEEFEKLLEINDFLTLPGKYILVEFSMNYEFPFVRDYIYELIKKGYKPILAHPERYRFILTEKNAMDHYEQMIDWGLHFQLNLFSLLGAYGDTIQKMALRLIQAGLYEYACTDIHRVHQIPMLDEISVSKHIEALFKHNSIKNHQFLT